MADTDATNVQVSGAVTQQAPATKETAYVTVPASGAPATPEPASADLVWTSGSETINYRATAAHLDVRGDDGKLIGQMFSLSYVALEDGKPSKNRPVTFCYNGGPGSASVPINFGGIGPRRVATDGMNHLSSSAPVEDNPYTLLRESDLVFLDALGTGWSTLAADADPKKVFSVDGDADCFCRAITTWLESNGRWSSPVYLFGESYGTVRNAVLMRLLGERSVKVAGVTMLSAIFDWCQVQPGEDLYYLGMMPTYAAAAQYFGKAGKGKDVDDWFDHAMDFADDELAPALLKGDRLSDARESKVARDLSRYIGLPASQIKARHLRIDLDEFRRSIVADEGKVCGRLDMRFISDAPSYVQTSSDWFAGEDAANDAVDACWAHAFRAFCSDELGYHGPARYLMSNYERIGGSWGWSHFEPGTTEEAQAPNVTLDVAVALRRNPTMKLAILGGRYDAATTYWNVVHDMSAQFLSPELKDRVEWHRYGCGHMAYTDVPTLKQMSADMEAFYAKQ